MRSLGRWPVPCTTREAAVTFFGGPSPSAEAWAGGLEQRDGGWWPRFDADVMARTLREATARSYWGEWERISCPVLVVGAGRGQLSAADARAMVERGQRCSWSSCRRPATTSTWTRRTSGALWSAASSEPFRPREAHAAAAWRRRPSRTNS
jgi:hypothetical protein